VASQVRFREEAKPRYTACARKLMPLTFANRAKLHLGYYPVKKTPEQRRISQRLRGAPKSFDDPLDSIHISQLDYACGFPHSGQNFAPRAIGFPHSPQNFVSEAAPPAAAGVPPPPGVDVAFFTASIMA